MFVHKLQWLVFMFMIWNAKYIYEKLKIGALIEEWMSWGNAISFWMKFCVCEHLYIAELLKDFCFVYVLTMWISIGWDMVYKVIIVGLRLFMLIFPPAILLHIVNVLLLCGMGMYTI